MELEARVFRGFALWPASARIGGLVVSYAGAFAVLWALGLSVRGWRGWALVIAPLVVMLVTRIWAWRRISVELAQGCLRYEGVHPRRDFEVDVDAIQAVYRDPILSDHPLVLVLRGGDERVVAHLAPSAVDRLREHLVTRGAREIHAA